MKILIINPFGIGDVIFSTPLVEILRKEFPGSFIAYVCNRRVSEILNTNPNLDRVFVYEKDEYRKIWKGSKFEYHKQVFKAVMAVRSYKFDLLVDLSMACQYNLFGMVIGIKKRIGFNYRNRGRFLTDKVNISGFDEKHVIDYYLEVLTLLGIDIKKYPASPRIYATEQDLKKSGEALDTDGIKSGDFLIGVVPGCGASWGADAAQRRWGKASFTDLINRLTERYGAKIVLFGDKKETEICGDIQSAVKGKVTNYCGRTSLPELAAFMSKCALVITNDGGPLHMAIGLGVKTVSIFGPVDEKIYGPYAAGGTHAVVSNKGLSCRPCYRKFKYSKCSELKCLNGISVEDVLAGVEKVLKR